MVPGQILFKRDTNNAVGMVQNEESYLQGTYRVEKNFIGVGMIICTAYILDLSGIFYHGYTLGWATGWVQKNGTYDLLTKSSTKLPIQAFCNR